MKLGDAVIIAEEKLTRYLLLPRRKNDKSGYLARAGYSLTKWQRLDADLRELARTREADPDARTPFGEFFVVRGQLRGPNGVILGVKTIWIRLQGTDETRFVTLVPDAERS